MLHPLKGSLPAATAPESGFISTALPAQHRGQGSNIHSPSIDSLCSNQTNIQPTNKSEVCHLKAQLRHTSNRALSRALDEKETITQTTALLTHFKQRPELMMTLSDIFKERKKALFSLLCPIRFIMGLRICAPSKTINQYLCPQYPDISSNVFSSAGLGTI